MPIYEYQAIDTLKGCGKCRHGFEAIQGVKEDPLPHCPACKGDIKKLISRCHAVVLEQSPDSISLEKKIHEYEKTNRWSHAAELADSFAHQTHDPQMKERAWDNYKKAGYDPATLDRQSKLEKG